MNKTFAGADEQKPRNKSTPKASDRRSEMRIGTSQRAASSGQESKRTPKPVILPTVERRTGVERADAGKSPYWWTAPTPDSRPPLT